MSVNKLEVIKQLAEKIVDYAESEDPDLGYIGYIADRILLLTEEDSEAVVGAPSSTSTLALGMRMTAPMV